MLIRCDYTHSIVVKQADRKKLRCLRKAKASRPQGREDENSILFSIILKLFHPFGPVT